MKKLFLICSLALMSLVTAQTHKGNWILDAKTGLGFNNFSVSVDGNTGPKFSVFTVTPSVGYFTVDNLAVGAEIGYAYLSIKDAVYISNFLDSSESHTVKDLNINLITVMPTLTYYFPTASQVKPYLGGGVGFSSMEVVDRAVNGMVWNVNGGITYLLNSSVGINGGLRYNQYRNKKDGVNTKLNNLSVAAGFSIFL